MILNWDFSPFLPHWPHSPEKIGAVPSRQANNPEGAFEWRAGLLCPITHLRAVLSSTMRKRLTSCIRHVITSLLARRTKITEPYCTALSQIHRQGRCMETHL